MIKTLAVALGLWASFLAPLSAQTLKGLDGRPHSIPELLAQRGTEALVLVVWCSHCGSCRGNERALAEYAAQNGEQVKVYAVDPHPADTADRIRRFLAGQGLQMTVLRDPSQTLISSLKIDRTTTAMVYDREGRLRYLGPFQGDGKGFARDAVEDVLAGRDVSMKSRPLKGCLIPGP